MHVPEVLILSRNLASYKPNHEVTSLALDWIDVTNLSINNLLLLERVQLSWFPGWLPEKELAITLQANPVVDWYLHHKCPEITPWLDKVFSDHAVDPLPSQEVIRQAERTVMSTINDLMVYVVDPTIYDAQPFLGWDPIELTSVTDFRDKVVIDVGSGTGKLAFIAAETAAAVFPVEPVGNLRLYIKQKARANKIANVFPVDGLITDIPFPTGFADITMGGHVYGAYPDVEYTEMKRVTKPGGMVIHCPGTDMTENKTHEYLISQGFDFSIFVEPPDGHKRKYWKQVE